MTIGLSTKNPPPAAAAATSDCLYHWDFSDAASVSLYSANQVQEVLNQIASTQTGDGVLDGQKNYSLERFLPTTGRGPRWGRAGLDFVNGLNVATFGVTALESVRVNPNSTNPPDVTDNASMAWALSVDNTGVAEYISHSHMIYVNGTTLTYFDNVNTEVHTWTNTDGFDTFGILTITKHSGVWEAWWNDTSLGTHTADTPLNPWNFVSIGNSFSAAEDFHGQVGEMYIWCEERTPVEVSTHISAMMAKWGIVTTPAPITALTMAIGNQNPLFGIGTGTTITWDVTVTNTHTVDVENLVFGFTVGNETGTPIFTSGDPSPVAGPITNGGGSSATYQIEYTVQAADPTSPTALTFGMTVQGTEVGNTPQVVDGTGSVSVIIGGGP